MLIVPGGSTLTIASSTCPFEVFLAIRPNSFPARQFDADGYSMHCVYEPPVNLGNQYQEVERFGGYQDAGTEPLSLRINGKGWHPFPWGGTLRLAGGEPSEFWKVTAKRRRLVAKRNGLKRERRITRYLPPLTTQLLDPWVEQIRGHQQTLVFDDTGFVQPVNHNPIDWISSTITILGFAPTGLIYDCIGYW